MREKLPNTIFHDEENNACCFNDTDRCLRDSTLQRMYEVFIRNNRQCAKKNLS
jgi:hypothetical protein